MLTPFRLAPIRFTPFAPAFAIIGCFFALGCFDTVEAQSLTVSTTNLAFSAAQGASPAGSQSVSVGSTGGNVSFIISSSATWLGASTGPFNGDGGTSGETLTVQVTSTSLASGSYTGTITLTPTNGTAVATISVSLSISGTGTQTSAISASPQQLAFDFELNQTAPPAQTTQIVSSGISLPFSFSTNSGPVSPNCPGGWFKAAVSSNSTPATLTVSIVTSGVGAGTCTGNIALNSTTPSNGTTTFLVGVTLYASSSPLLNISIPAGMQTLTLQQGVKPAQFGPTTGNPLELTSSDPNTQLPFTVTYSPTNSWLSVSPLQGTTPLGLNVEIFPGAALAVGNYTGSITITSQGLLNNVETIPIALTLTPFSSVTVSPSGTQNFNELQGGSLPSPLTLTLTGAADTSPSFTTSVIQGSGGQWLGVSPASGSLIATPTTSTGSVTLSVLQNNLAQGVYSSQAVISFNNSAIPQILISVSLTVGAPAAALVATPPSLSFSYQSGGTTPPGSQAISITNPATGSLPYTVASISDNWIAVSPTTGNTPGTVTVSVNPQSLQPGSYNGSFVLTSSGVSTTVPVSLFVSASTTPQPFIISNAASGGGGQLSPGEIITIKGSGLGPGTPMSFTVNTLANPTLGGVQVTFNGYSGTLLYVSSTQINVTVPYEIAGTASASIVVNYQGAQSAPISEPVGTASLGLFTDNATGSGQAAVVNQNNTFNTAATPAPEGSYISVYATGGGQTNPTSTDGEVSSSTSLLPLVLQQYVTATIGGKAAPILFAGAAPGDVTGVVQFNIQVPTGITGSALPIVVTINGPAGVQSQAGATVAVQ
jgi:uncharacterized protein (TIGR03437 family)